MLLAVQSIEAAKLYYEELQRQQAAKKLNAWKLQPSLASRQMRTVSLWRNSRRRTRTAGYSYASIF